MLEADLLVGADGRDSWVRRQVGIEVKGWPYGQSAIVATVRPEHFHRETAWQRFLPSGPLAFLPLPDGLCSIVWSTRPEEAERLMALDDTAFGEALTAAFGCTLGEVTLEGPRGLFPLRLQHALEYVRPGLALVGDAAHAIHPLAGQGVNLGLMDAAALAEVLLAARQRGRPMGSELTLSRYQRWRKGENLAMMAAMDGFKRLFSNRIPPLRLVRNLGLLAADRAEPLKRIIVRRAMGLSGDLPRLARWPDCAA